MRDVNEITELVERYFDATWRGDVDQLRTLFDPRAVVTGEVDGDPYYKTIDDYLAGVAQRKSPAELGEPVDMELLMLDVHENIAVAKLHVRMLGFNYYNYFSIMRQRDKWLIIAKTLTNVRWNVIVVCLLLTALAMVPQAFVTHWWQLAALRVLMGMTLAGLLPSIGKLVRQSVDERATGQMLGYLQSAQFGGQVLGPVIGGQIGVALGLHSVFFMTAALLAACAALALRVRSR